MDIRLKPATDERDLDHHKMLLTIQAFAGEKQKQAIALEECVNRQYLLNELRRDDGKGFAKLKIHAEGVDRNFMGLHALNMGNTDPLTTQILDIMDSANKLRIKQLVDLL